MKMLKLCGVALALALPATGASAERLFGLTGANTLVTFDSTNPSVTRSASVITGVAAGDTLVGIDLRPANRTLYTVAASGNVYSIALSGATATATLVGDIGNLNGNRFGIDFNPVPDRLRFVTDFDQNFRVNVNPTAFAAITDGTINAPGAEALAGVAYTNSRAGALTTTLYGLDASGNQLLRSTNPNAGEYIEVGTLSGNIDLGGRNNVGFDISGATGDAFFSNGGTLYSLNLSNAAASSLGAIGAGELVGLTAAGVPEPATWAMMIVGFGAAGGMLRRRRAQNKTAAAFA